MQWVPWAICKYLKQSFTPNSENTCQIAQTSYLHFMRLTAFKNLPCQVVFKIKLVMKIISFLVLDRTLRIFL